MQNGTMFGAFGQNNAQSQQQPTPLQFGQTQQQQPQQQSSLFSNLGQSTTNTTGSGGGLFGNASNTAQLGNLGQSTTNAAGNSGNLFGVASNAAQLGQSTTNATGSSGGGLFGNTSNPAQLGNLGQSTMGGGLFGNTSNPAQLGNLGQSTTNATGSSGGLFGNASNPAQLGSLGQSTTNATGNSGTLFGNTSNTAQFGNLGQPTTNASGSSGGLFGNTSNTAQLGASTFGIPNAGSSSAYNFFASRGTAGSMPNQQQGDSAQAQFGSLVQRIESIAQAWDSNSPQCRFQHFFYNLVEPSQVHLYGRPANATDDTSWQKAVRENPDPTCYVPALALGFDDLQKRVEAQRQQSTAHQEKMKELKTRIAALSDTHSLSNSPRLERAAALQMQLNQRLVRLSQHLHLLIPSVRSSSIRPEEEALRAALEALEDEIKRPGGTGRLKGKLSELWALIGAIEAARERDRKGTDGSVGWTVVDPEGLQRISQILTEQQNGMAHLTKIVQGHVKDLDVILGRDSREREADAFSSSQASQVLLGASIRATQ